MDLKTLCDNALVIVKKTGSYIREEGSRFTSSHIESKGKNDFVTLVDKGAEERIVKGLKDLLPESGFIAEEGTNDEKGEVYNWIIDPIDGTTNFIHGSPPYAISVALMEHTELVIGIIYEVAADECFHSYKGGAAFLNDKKIEVSKAKKVADSLIATGFPYNSFGRMKPFMKSLEHFFVNTHGVRRLGSAATDLAYVACGRYDGFYEYNLKPWDIAAGAFLVQQAGGKVGDFHGTNDFLFGGEIVAGNANNYSEFQKQVGQFMNTD